jgi:hypothetical protein
MSNVCPTITKINPNILEFPNYLIVLPLPPIQHTFGEPPLLTFQDYTTLFNLGSFEKIKRNN